MSSQYAELIETDPQQAMVERMLEFKWDPYGCVKFSFPWGEGELAADPAPREFQKNFLRELGAHLQNPETRYTVFRKAISSGHGIGKSSIVAWVVHWGKSTSLDCKIIITAGTGDQLKTKTQPEVSKWLQLAINSDWFDVNVQSIKMNDAEHENTWRTDFTTWSEENPQAFAGAHNKGKRLIIIFEEAAGVSDAIWKVVEGALTDADTEIIFLAFSQCTRGEGAFFEACFGDQKHRWNPEVIDSREVEGTNIKEIQESIELYGDDSDHVRVRYKGLFPLAGGGKFIDLELVNIAQHAIGQALEDDPLVIGVDFAWGGSDENVIRFRKGLDARSIPPIKVKGSLTKDPAIMIGKIADVLGKTYNGDRVAMAFFDSAGIASSVHSGVRNLGFEDRITLVNFGADSPLQHCAYWRDYMWDEMKKWMSRGGAIDKDHDLAADLQKPILVHDRKQRVKLESKEDMFKRLKKMGLTSASPDNGDALALTFAVPVGKPRPLTVGTAVLSARERAGDGAWMG